MRYQHSGTCDIIAQATLVGPQPTSVRVIGETDGQAQPYVTIRVGSVLLRVENQAALRALTDAVREANVLSPQAFSRRPGAHGPATSATPARQPARR